MGDTNSLEKHLSLIRERNKVGFEEFLANDVLQDALLFQFQLGMQTCIDLAAHIASGEGLGAPGSSSELFCLLNDAGIIDLPMTEQKIQAVGFRNPIAHEYGRIDMKIAYQAVTENFLELDCLRPARQSMAPTRPTWPKRIYWGRNVSVVLIRI